VSWLRLCPRTPVSGVNRIASVLRMAATSVQRSKTALGAAFRRIARRKAAAVAVFATARRLARLIYRMLRFGHDHVDIGEKAYEQRFQIERLAAIKETARSFGHTLVLQLATS
jgi:transposase